MDEYITWSDELKQFDDNITLKELLKDVCETWDVYEVEEGKYFRNIGLKDINGKNIYADSSIVEFNNSQLWNKYNGIFFYNKERLCYQIRIIDGVRNSEIIPYDIYCSDFKIIDTIQENKLGLV